MAARSRTAAPACDTCAITLGQYALVGSLMTVLQYAVVGSFIGLGLEQALTSTGGSLASVLGAVLSGL